jgi:hypothetical protein
MTSAAVPSGAERADAKHRRSSQNRGNTMSIDKLRDAIRKAGLGVTAAGGLAFAEDAYATCMAGCKEQCQSCRPGCSSCNPQGTACRTTAKDIQIGIGLDP